MKPHPILSQLATVRRSRKLSQPEAAARMHVCSNTLSSWETGRHAPHLDDLDRLAALFGLRLALVPADGRASVPCPLPGSEARAFTVEVSDV